MRAAYRQINDRIRDELLERVQEGSPGFFENLIVELLVALGLGGGVDGVIDQDALGLDRVHIQAKRYGSENKIGAYTIRDVFGSLDRLKAAKSVFVITSDFTKEAEQTAEYLSKRIALINGRRLGEPMI